MPESSEKPELVVSLVDSATGEQFPFDLVRPSIGQTYVVTLGDGLLAIERVKGDVYTAVSSGDITTQYSVNFTLPHHGSSKTIHDNGEFQLSRDSRGRLGGIRTRKGVPPQSSHLSSTIPEPEDEEDEGSGSKSGETQAGSRG
jgi:hypothetical protein